ncbi:hypothetical protein HERIO_998 [Hepatospora eriocheir]|uniref:Uncharacterized protein n=1 Tax=Hepatospora eriocheir TaxID=1081669 RepID=A0A1X0QBN4_9MICR|nr:hypothetical protein HERIO_998 [Hepatospora eriocheir]
MAVFQYFTDPLLSPEINKLLFLENKSFLIGKLCPCNIVSKLKNSPFHIVISPELDPDNSLLPSGIQTMLFTGLLCLLIHICINCIG